MAQDNFSNIGKILIFVGIGIVVLGFVIFLFAKIPFFGKLPGDISVKREGFSFYFPVSTSIIISIFLTVVINVILYLIFRFRK